MGFFDDLKVVGADLFAKSKVVAKEAAQKAQDATEMAKIKVDIAAREKEIKDLYTKIGKAYYEEYKDDAPEFAEDIEAINAKLVTISELNSKYEMYKDALTAAKEAATEASVETDDVEEIIDVYPVEEVVEEVAEAVEEKLEEVAEAVEEKLE